MSVTEQRCKLSGNIIIPSSCCPEKLNPRSRNLVLVQRLTYLAVFAERRPDRRLAEMTGDIFSFFFYILGRAVD